jgi:hypothetical protein
MELYKAVEDCLGRTRLVLAAMVAVGLRTAKALHVGQDKKTDISCQR